MRPIESNESISTGFVVKGPIIKLQRFQIIEHNCSLKYHWLTKKRRRKGL